MRQCDKIDWSSWEIVSDDLKSRLEKQLRREVGVEHRLFGTVGKMRVLAKDGASDEILAADPADMINAFIVHLVWSDGPGTDVNFPQMCSITKALIPDEFS